MLMGKLNVNADISAAEMLPSAFYTNDDYFEASKERIFSKTWQFAGLKRDLDNTLPFRLLDPLLGEPLLIIENGDVRCFSNVCTHRANILIEDRCKIDGIRCRYHGRRFDLNGRFLSMPEFEGVRDFPSKEDDLNEVPLREWAGLFFVSLEPEHEFEQFFGPVLEQFGEFGKGAEISKRDYLVDAHWALYCENYLEGFHIPYVHKALNKELDFSTYETRTWRLTSLQTARAADSASKSEQCSVERPAYYYFVFPNMMFNFYPWGLSLNVIEPVTKDQTRVRYISLVTDSSKRDLGAGADLETVEFEDQRIVASVQAGIRSRFFRRGRYSVRREAGLHHFHRLIAEFMNNGETI